MKKISVYLNYNVTYIFGGGLRQADHRMKLPNRLFTKGRKIPIKKTQRRKWKNTVHLIMNDVINDRMNMCTRICMGLEYAVFFPILNQHQFGLDLLRCANKCLSAFVILFIFSTGLEIIKYPAFGNTLTWLLFLKTKLK